MGGKKGRPTRQESSRNSPNFLSYKYIQYPTDKRQEKGFSSLCISKEVVISRLSDTKKLISKLDFNWVWEQLANCSSPSLHFAPVSHSILIYFLVFSPCFAIVQSSGSEVTPNSTEFRKSAHISRLSLAGSLPQQRHLHGEALQRPPQLRAEGRLQGPGWHTSSLSLPSTGTEPPDW